MPAQFSPQSTPPAAECDVDIEASSTIQGVLILTVRGVLDLLTAPRLVEELNVGLAAAHSALIVDLSEVDFLASRAMAVLVSGSQAATEASKQFCVVAHGPHTSRPIKMMGLDRELRMYATLATAVEGVKG